MPKFKFKISRTYEIVEGFEREYEAATVEDARRMADAEAEESNMDCPDDCSEDESGGSRTGDFYAEPVE
jgi:hypothetical protein